MKANSNLKSEKLELDDEQMNPPRLTLALARTYALLARSLRSESYLQRARECLTFLNGLDKLRLIESNYICDSKFDAEITKEFVYEVDNVA